MSEHSELVVRSARPGDAEVIAGVHVESWRAAYAGQLPQPLLDALSVDQRARMWREVLEESAAERRVEVADRAGRALGFVATGPSRQDPPAARVGELYALYVTPSCWSTGVGRALLASATSHFARSGMREALLWVLASNLRACRFYERAGWTHDGRVKIEHLAGLPDFHAEVSEACYRRQFVAAE